MAAARAGLRVQESVELKILELRERAKAALGSKFDLKDFHAVVLENGAVPMTLLETIVNQWIASAKD